MPSTIIYCRDCEEEKKEIERSGAFQVISCSPLPEQEDVPESQKKCEIEWVVNDI